VRSRVPNHCTFAGIRTRILALEGVDIRPLWRWLIAKRALTGHATPRGDAIFSRWGALSHLGRHDHVRKCGVCGVWRVVLICSNVVIATDHAAFVGAFIGAVELARNQIAKTQTRIERASRRYLVDRGRHLAALHRMARGHPPEQWPRVSRTFGLPDQNQVVAALGGLRVIDSYLERLKGDLRDARPISTGPGRRPTGPGRPERVFLKQVESVLLSSGFTESAVAAFRLDGRDDVDAETRVHDRRRRKRVRARTSTRIRTRMQGG
jgi:hypothetical protein